MPTPELNVVTGAFGYTGKYITRRLLAMGKRVKTLTGHPNRQNPLGGQVDIAPFNFDNPRELAQSLRGATTLYNTYWVRFPRGNATFDQAVENTQTLFRAAEEAGVRRIVHISITNPSEESPLPYFRGKALLEKAIRNSGLSYAIIRPTVIFGVEDILINNIAWLLRRFPIFAVPGAGEYQLQPIFVEDVAEVAISAAHKDENAIIDAAGPDVYTFDRLVRLIAEKIRSRARIVHLPSPFVLAFSQIISLAVNDVVLTRDETAGLMANLLISNEPPMGHTRLGDWLSQNTDSVGARYASELARHYRSA
jgi:NADH dehydrogenase